MTTAEGARVGRRSRKQEIGALSAFVRRMEKRYEIGSAEAMEAVRAGTMRETAEVARWIAKYRTLQDLLTSPAEEEAGEEEYRIRVHTAPIEDGIRRLERYVQRMERRYEMKSADALRSVRDGRMRETYDVCNWLINYRALEDLRTLLPKPNASS